MNIKKTMLAFAVAASVAFTASATAFPTAGGDIGSLEPWGGKMPGYASFNCRTDRVPEYYIQNDFTYTCWAGPASAGKAKFSTGSNTLTFTGPWRQSAFDQEVEYVGRFSFGAWALFGSGTENSKAILNGASVSVGTFDETGFVGADGAKTIQGGARNTTVTLDNNSTITVGSGTLADVKFYLQTAPETMPEEIGGNVFEIKGGSTFTAKSIQMGVPVGGKSGILVDGGTLALDGGSLILGSVAGGNRNFCKVTNGGALTFTGNSGIIVGDSGSYNEVELDGFPLSISATFKVGNTANSQGNVLTLKGANGAFGYSGYSWDKFISPFGTGHDNTIAVNDHATFTMYSNLACLGTGSHNVLRVLDGGSFQVMSGVNYKDFCTGAGDANGAATADGNANGVVISNASMTVRTFYAYAPNGVIELSNGSIVNKHGGSVVFGKAADAGVSTNVSLVVNGGANSIGGAVTFNNGSKLIVKGAAENTLTSGALAFGAGSTFAIERGTANTFTTGAISVDSGSAVTFGAGTTNSFASAMVVTGTVVTVKGGSVTSLAKGISLCGGSKLRFDFTDGAFAAAPIDISGAIGLDDSSSFDYVGIEELQRSIQKPIDIPLIKGANANCFYSFYHNTLARLISELPAKCSLFFSEGTHQGTLTLHVKPVGLGLSIILR